MALLGPNSALVRLKPTLKGPNFSHMEAQFNHGQARLGFGSNSTLALSLNHFHNSFLIFKMSSFPNDLSSANLVANKRSLKADFKTPMVFLLHQRKIMFLNERTKTKKIVLGSKMQEMTRDVCYSICYGQNWPKHRINLKTDLESQDVGASAHTLTKSDMFLL